MAEEPKVKIATWVKVLLCPVILPLLPVTLILGGGLIFITMLLFSYFLLLSGLLLFPPVALWAKLFQPKTSSTSTWDKFLLHSKTAFDATLTACFLVALSPLLIFSCLPLPKGSEGKEGKENHAHSEVHEEEEHEEEHHHEKHEEIPLTKPRKGEEKEKKEGKEVGKEEEEKEEGETKEKEGEEEKGKRKREKEEEAGNGKGEEGETGRGTSLLKRGASFLPLLLFFGLGLVLPIVDVITDFLYLSSLLQLSLSSFPDHPEQIRELYIWKVIAVVSSVLGLLITLATFLYLLRRFWTSKAPSWRGALQEVVDHYNGNSEEKEPSHFLSWLRLLGTVVEDFTQVTVVTATRGYAGFEFFEIASWVTSLLSIAFFWSTFSSRFLFPGKESRDFMLKVLFTILIGSTSLGPLFSIFFILEDFSYCSRPHQIRSDVAHIGEEYCPDSSPSLYRLDPDFDFSEILWKKAYFNVTIQRETTEEIRFLSLEEYENFLDGGMLIFECPFLHGVYFPKARILTELTLDSNPLLTTLLFPLVTDLDLTLRNLSSLQDFTFPDLTGNLDAISNENLRSLSIKGSFFNFLYISNNPRLMEISLEDMVYMNGLNIASHESLPILFAPQLYQVFGSLFLSDLPALGTISLPSLHLVESFFLLESGPEYLSLPVSYFEASGLVMISDNPKLKEISFPNLEYFLVSPHSESAQRGIIAISNNTVLETVSLPNLSSENLGKIILEGNPALQMVALPSLRSAFWNSLLVSPEEEPWDCVVVFEDLQMDCSQLASWSNSSLFDRRMLTLRETFQWPV